eukprot:1245694-Prymnesium_polylepis.1
MASNARPPAVRLPRRMRRCGWESDAALWRPPHSRGGRRAHARMVSRRFGGLCRQRSQGCVLH